MKRSSTLFLKFALIIIGLPVLAICIALMPLIVRNVSDGIEGWDILMLGLLTFMYLAAIPFYMALFQAFKLLIYIDRNTAFSDQSVRALKRIKYHAMIITGLYILNLPLFYIYAELDDAPGVIIVGMAFIFAPLVITVFAALLEKLLQEAIRIKTENDLTV
ncbi:DUF2975 domain-containing protein [Salinicoccus halodurans]|uniref:Membrane protein n=1 Tax=Salinicoccus halodurans TaxID=407035 RepID=A0A0F7HL05_9STAP|nr:DUF2975 domain-containing protein [Salinicoccus halodurans]AKG73829.1 membrane protein [Salinicoccus halodurans]SFK56507.1 Protein of unknown function [Salinicoccus halodurans]